MPSLFSLSHPITLFQVWFVVYLYLLPFLLYASWSCIALMDLAERADDDSRIGWGALIVLLPLLGAASYLLATATTLRRTVRIAMVVAGLCVWLLPLGAGWWLAGGPLGPKALS